MDVTDVILDINQLQVSSDPAPEVALLPQSSHNKSEIQQLVANEYPTFLQYYATPSESTEIYAIMLEGDLVGSVLIEKQPAAAESSSDAAIACLLIAERHREKGLGSAAILSACQLLDDAGYERVIAEWVASLDLYRRLGFRVWRTRSVAD